jgi:hypothetical protein
MAGAIVMVAPGAQAVLLGVDAPTQVATGWMRDLAGTPQCLGPTPALSFEMAVDTQVVASAELPRREDDSAGLAAAAREPALPLPEPERRFRLNGQKYASPVGGRTEAGVAMSLGSHLSLQLNYARTAQVPMMGYANDNGILARLRFGF